MTTVPFLLALPWLGLILFEAFVARFPSELPEVGGGDAGAGGRRGERGTSHDVARSASPDPQEDAPHDVPRSVAEAPLISVVVPARNEARDIETCVRSITASAWPAFEVIVVDDRSEDATAEIARSVPSGNARRVVIVDGGDLPPGWLGKPWACHQGYAEARGELLLFTDADTTHAPDLLERAVRGRESEDADLLTVVGRQLMESFWERLVQPHVFFHMLLRFPDFERVADNDNWRDAIANGQFLLFTREAYEGIDGHRSVKDEVVEDLALAQVVKRAGLRLRIRSAEGSLATRMYRSLGEIVQGWSKNLLMGGLQSVPRWARPVLPAVSFFGGFVLWLLAPSMLAAALLGGVEPALAPSRESIVWAGAVYALSVILWMRFHHRMGTSRAYAFLYPLAAAVFARIFLRSWIRGRHVEWKGRRYRIPSAAERP